MAFGFPSLGLDTIKGKTWRQPLDARKGETMVRHACYRTPPRQLATGESQRLPHDCPG